MTKKKIKPLVFFPPFLLLLAAVGLNFIDKKTFEYCTTEAYFWVRDTFGSSFCIGAVLMLAVSVGVFFLPCGKWVIGGPDAKPMLTKWRLFAIALTAGIGIGIVFFGTGEPISHLANPPQSLSIEPYTEDAALFAMASAYLHWTFVPYAMYCVVGLMFALSYYNMGKPFSLGSPLYPILGDRGMRLLSDAIDAICLYALVAGMAVSLGGGMLLIGDGLQHLLGITPTKTVLALIAAACVTTFTLSAVSGLLKGIRLLAHINTIIFLGLMAFVLIVGPTAYIAKLGCQSASVFVRDFFQNSLCLWADGQDPWPEKWTMFYWTWWFAWTPIIGVFLGRISYGYTVRQFIVYNLVLPSAFGAVWFTIFGGTAIYMQMYQEVGLVELLNSKGIESVIYGVLAQLPLAGYVIPLFLFTVFLSFVTCADSTTSAMSGLSATGISPGSSEPPSLLKVLWGTLAGTIAWVMINFAGLDGLRMLSNLGGLAGFVLCMAITTALVKTVLTRRGQEQVALGSDTSNEPSEAQ